MDTKTLAAGLGVLGVLGLAIAGVVQITTPEAAQCAVDLADAKARLELLTEVKDTCKTALTACAQPGVSP